MGKRAGARMILEGIVTTRNDDGSANISPMGPAVDSSMQKMTLRPFQSSQTFRNLRRHGEGVLHVVDDVLLLARAALGQIEPAPAMVAASKVSGFVLREACRWYEFGVVSLDDSQQRARIDVEVVASGRQRDFFGFNRAKHAVVEAAILATRVAFLPRDEILEEFERLAVIVRKTGGEQEFAAYELLYSYVQSAGAAAAVVPGCSSAGPA